MMSDEEEFPALIAFNEIKHLFTIKILFGLVQNYFFSANYVSGIANIVISSFSKPIISSTGN
jgi:hypothetical protein